jgi:predicted  nucleic acid-binding Zn-ribbon protein
VKKVDALKAELAEHQKEVLHQRAKLEQEFKARAAERPDAAKKVDPALLTRYESIRQKHGGLGMAMIDKRGACMLCGTLLPRKTVEAALEDRVITCETCHRILYASEGLI